MKKMITKDICDKETFINIYCKNCGSQRCEGVDSEWFNGCLFKERVQIVEKCQEQHFIEKEPLLAWLEAMHVSEYIIKAIEDENRFPVMTLMKIR